MKLVVIGVLLLMPVVVYAQATQFVSIKNDRAGFDESRFPAEMKAGVAILNNKCESCHSLGRVISALEDGHTISGLPFTRSGVRQFVIRKMRRPDVKLSSQEAAELLKVLQYMADQTPPLAQNN